MYAASACLVLIIMIMGVSMVNSFDRMKSVQSTLETLADRNDTVETRVHDQDIFALQRLIVEDIVDSGRTLSYLMKVLESRNPSSLRLCTLLDKPQRRVKNVKVDYCCFEIPDEFVVGYGLDYAQKYRNLPFIGVVESR